MAVPMTINRFTAIIIGIMIKQNMRTNLLKKAMVLMAMTAIFAFPAASLAAQFRANESGTLSVGEAVAEDLYAAGNGVVVSAPISGDVLAAGGNIVFNSDVSESILAAAGTINVSGTVADDARLLGGNIFVNGSVSHDVLALGGQVNVASTASVGRDLAVLAATVVIDAPVGGNLYVRGGDVVINSEIKGAADIKADTLSFGPRASIGGKLVYSSPKETKIADGLAQGGVEYSKIEANRKGLSKGLASMLSAAFLFKLVSAFVLVFGITAIFRRRSYDLVQASFAKFWPNALYGFAALVIVPIGALLLLVTMVGAPLALISMAAYAIAAGLSCIFTPALVGGWLFKVFGKKQDYPVSVYSILVGAVVYVFAGLVPVFGWVFNLVFFLAALGVIAKTVLENVSRASSEKR